MGEIVVQGVPVPSATMESIKDKKIEDLSIIQLGELMLASGLFTDLPEVSTAVVKIIMGRELGFPIIASLTGIYSVKGRPALQSSLLAAAIAKSGRYMYRVMSLTDDGCEIDFYAVVGTEREFLGKSTFTSADAKRTESKSSGYKHYPRNMYFARALTNGYRWFCPDVLGGGIYTTEEFDKDI